MIGQITVAGTRAVLSDEGLWVSSDPALRAVLNARFSPADDGPAAGLFGRAQVVAAAQALACTHWLAPEPAPEPDEFGPDIVY
jgi:hypothetical protein